jgi:DNA repair exonuclease SbcCD ATPase subunit
MREFTKYPFPPYTAPGGRAAAVRAMAAETERLNVQVARLEADTAKDEAAQLRAELEEKAVALARIEEELEQLRHAAAAAHEAGGLDADTDAQYAASGYPDRDDLGGPAAEKRALADRRAAVSLRSRLEHLTAAYRSLDERRAALTRENAALRNELHSLSTISVEKARAHTAEIAALRKSLNVFVKGVFFLFCFVLFCFV